MTWSFGDLVSDVKISSDGGIGIAKMFLNHPKPKR